MSDLDELAEEQKKNPEEPLWQLLARLGWVPPATAADFRRRIHELEGEHKVAADLVEGDMVSVPARKAIIVVKDPHNFIYVTLDDGTTLRYSRMDIVHLG